MYKLIACDLDETLLNTDKEICSRNIEAIKRAERDYGVRFVPATGRGYTCIDNVLHTLDVFDASHEYTISNNGGVVTENKIIESFPFMSFPLNWQSSCLPLVSNRMYVSRFLLRRMFMPFI